MSLRLMTRDILGRPGKLGGSSDDGRRHTRHIVWRIGFSG